MTVLISARRAVAIIALALSLVTATSGSAEAATDYTPSGGPYLNLVGTNISLTNVLAAQSLTCTQFAAGGRVASPGEGRPFGAAAVDLDSPTERCSNPIMGAATIDASWDLAVVEDNTGTTWPTRLARVSGTVRWPNCIWTFGGSVDGALDTATQRWSPITSGLVVTSVLGSMCATIDFLVGDPIDIAGHLTNVPPAGSSPLSLS